MLKLKQFLFSPDDKQFLFLDDDQRIVKNINTENYRFYTHLNYPYIPLSEIWNKNIVKTLFVHCIQQHMPKTKASAQNMHILYICIYTT